MVSSHAGTDKWENLFEERSKFLMNTKWNGRNYSLDRFTGVYCSSFIQLQEAAAQVAMPLQLPSEHTQVGYLIDIINKSDPDLRAAIASIRVDTNGMRSDFKAAVMFLLPVDPFINNKKENNKTVTFADAQALKNKLSSKTGNNLRWHMAEEYMQPSIRNSVLNSTIGRRPRKARQPLHNRRRLQAISQSPLQRRSCKQRLLHCKCRLIRQRRN